MAFSVEEKMRLAGIVQETYETVEARITEMAFDTERENYIRDRIEVYEAVQDSHVIYKGDGVDFNNQRKREAIRQELRKALGLSLISWELSGGYSQSITHTVPW